MTNATKLAKESKDKDKIDYSQKLGQLLLQGWALLDIPCSQDSCYGIPLMRSKDRSTFFCVCCQRYFIEEGNLLKEQQQQQQFSTSTLDSAMKGSLNINSTPKDNKVDESISSIQDTQSKTTTLTQNSSSLTNSNPNSWSYCLNQTVVNGVSSEAVLFRTFENLMHRISYLNDESDPTSRECFHDIKLCLDQILSIKYILS